MINRQRMYHSFVTNDFAIFLSLIQLLEPWTLKINSEEGPVKYFRQPGHLRPPFTYVSSDITI